MARLASRITTPAVLVAVVLGSFAVVLACAIAAGHLLALVERPDGATGFDSSITSWVVSHRTDVLTTVARGLSAIGSQKFLTPAVAIVVVLLVARRRFSLVAFLVVAWGGALLLYSLTKLFVHRSRPPSDIWLTHVGSTSFPSGHATQSLATFVALALVGAVWLPSARAAGITLAIALAIGVAWSRVYLGVHWTTDVIAGLLIAAAWLAITVRLGRAADAIEQRASQRRPGDSVVTGSGSAE